MIACTFPSHVKGSNVLGRDNDKKAVVRFLLGKPNPGQRGVPTIAIVGKDGIGKTTLAQLVYNDLLVLMNFKRRWWASISTVSDEKEILVRILRCIRTTSMNEKIHGLSISNLYAAVKESMNSHGKYLLVLDDVSDGDVDTDSSFYSRIMPILRCGTIESRIIITTRSTKVDTYMLVGQCPRPLGLLKPIDQIYELHGLTKELSWRLFNLTTSLPQKDHTEKWDRFAKNAVLQSEGVPLQIKTIAGLLATPDMIHDRIVSPYETMSLLRLSFNMLPSFLKPCLIYCSLFPKDYVFQTEELINLWVSQGLVPLSDFGFDENQGYEYFTELLNRVFFQEATVGECGEVVSCKMHGTVHDLVKSLAEDESCILTKQNSADCGRIRHLSVGYEMDSSWIIPPSLYPPPLSDMDPPPPLSDVDPPPPLSDMDPPPLLSFLSLRGGSINPLVLDELLTEFELLCALKLRHQEIKVVPSSIKTLRHLRYLDLSHNKFTYLPDSIVLLGNLLTLDISWCEQLELLPIEFGKMCSLRHLDTENCCRLRHMPPYFGQLTHLQRLSLFKVGKPIDDGRYSRLHELSGLQLRGKLEVKFDEDTVWDENDRLELPIGITLLTITNYPGMRLLPFMLSNLVSLHIGPSSKIEEIWLLRSLTSLRTMRLSYLEQLEYIEIGKARASAPFLGLKVLTLEGLPKFKGWSREAKLASTVEFGQLSELTIRGCRRLKSMPECPNLQMLELNDVNMVSKVNYLDKNLREKFIYSTASSLETISIWDCDLDTFEGGSLTSLHQLDLRYCYQLKELLLPPPEGSSLKQLVIQGCPKLELPEKDGRRGVDWDIFGHFLMRMAKFRSGIELRDWLQQHQALGHVYSIERSKIRDMFKVHLRSSVETVEQYNIVEGSSEYSAEIEGRDNMLEVPSIYGAEIKAKTGKNEDENELKLNEYIAEITAKDENELKLDEMKKHASSTDDSLGPPPKREKFNPTQQMK